MLAIIGNLFSGFQLGGVAAGAKAVGRKEGQGQATTTLPRRRPAVPVPVQQG